MPDFIETSANKTSVISHIDIMRDIIWITELDMQWQQNDAVHWKPLQFDG